MRQHRVRTYLDPDAVGPLPRSLLADDSDALSAARTLLRLPATPTEEISAADFIEAADPNRAVPSIASEAEFPLPTRGFGPHLAVFLALALGVLLLAVAFRELSRPEALGAPAGGPRQHGGPAQPQVEGTQVPENGAVPTPAWARSESPVPAQAPAAAPTVGTLRLDASLEGQRVFLDGVALSATAAILRCGPHEVAVGSPGRSRSIDVPCGGEVAIFR